MPPHTHTHTHNKSVTRQTNEKQFPRRDRPSTYSLDARRHQWGWFFWDVDQLKNKAGRRRKNVINTKYYTNRIVRDNADPCWKAINFDRLADSFKIVRHVAEKEKLAFYAADRNERSSNSLTVWQQGLGIADFWKSKLRVVFVCLFCLFFYVGGSSFFFFNEIFNKNKKKHLRSSEICEKAIIRRFIQQQKRKKKTFCDHQPVK